MLTSSPLGRVTFVLRTGRMTMACRALALLEDGYRNYTLQAISFAGDSTAVKAAVAMLHDRGGARIDLRDVPGFSGSFDGMHDLYEYDHSAYGDAVDKVLGRAKYVHSHRDIPEEVHERIGRLLCEVQKVPYVGRDTHHVFGEMDTRYLSDHVWGLLSRTNFPVGSTVSGIAYDGSIHEYVLVLESPPAAPVPAVPAAVEGVSLSENEKLNGYELRFPDKPEPGVIAALKSNGWRWSPKGRCWYVKRSPDAKAFAERLVSAA